MKSTVRLGLGLVVVSCLFAFAGCGDDDDAADPGSAGSAGQGGETQAHGGAAAAGLECKVIGELCHAADSGTGTAHECHETGHVGHADACAEAFDGCIAFCTRDDDGAGGGGGGTAQDGHCAALGELCHEVDDVNGPLHACHELGHVNNSAKCAAGFDACATQCLAARELLEVGEGTGGAGGASSGGASQGGASNGGVSSVGGAASGAGGAR